MLHANGIRHTGGHHALCKTGMQRAAGRQGACTPWGTCLSSSQCCLGHRARQTTSERANTVSCLALYRLSAAHLSRDLLSLRTARTPTKDIKAGTGPRPPCEHGPSKGGFCGSPPAAPGEHEASRRMKTELLVQMDGCSPSASQCQLLLVGATNRPEVYRNALTRSWPRGVPQGLNPVLPWRSAVLLSDWQPYTHGWEEPCLAAAVRRAAACRCCHAPWAAGIRNYAQWVQKVKNP